LCKLRIDFYGTGEVGDRPCFVPLVVANIAATDIGICILRINLYGTGVVGDRPCFVPLGRASSAAIVIGVRKLRIELYGTGVVRDRAPIVGIVKSLIASLKEVFCGGGICGCGGGCSRRVRR